MSDDVRKELADYWTGNGEYAMSYTVTRSAVDLFLSRNIVIPRSELPEAIGDSRYGTVDANGELFGVTGVWESPLRWREKAKNFLAIAEYLESDAAKEAEATAARNKRRDELAIGLGYANRYGSLMEPARNAIDRIIDLENRK
jgi:hypothetical protein